MINKDRLKVILEAYKMDFSYRKGELFKWRVIKRFQDNWDVNAINFEEMLDNSLPPSTDGLLAASNFFPRKMILLFAKYDPEFVRSMFISLFDESEDLFRRISDFISQSNEILERLEDGSKNHYQSENIISIYLWLKYPDKYYIYKYSLAKNLSVELESNYEIKSKSRNNPVEITLKNFFNLYNEVNTELRKDGELIDLVQNSLDDTCYKDDKFITLTIDFGFYLSHTFKEKNEKDNLVEEEKVGLVDLKIDTYTKEDFLEEVFMTESDYDRLTRVLENKKNIILMGAPGTGKTFTAERLAYSLMELRDKSRVEFVQFHQNYSYEDFIMGYKPCENGFELRNGVFYKFCEKAGQELDKDYYFIIDEINRGNLSKIFGELLMLLENDKRGKEVVLAYNGLRFSVPKNVYVIGMMNTADRSLAMMDYALRRRFSFFEMRPGFSSEGFMHYQSKLNDDVFNRIVEQIKELNMEIEQDPSLGKGFVIGHSYFCGIENCDESKLRDIVDYDIIPTLEEYYFDNESKLKRLSNNLLGVFS